MDGIPGLRILSAEIDVSRSPASGTAGESFGSMLKSAVEQVDEFHSQASKQIGELLDGGNVDVHSAMIAAEKADLSFQLMMQVRNKVVQAYQEVSRMQF